MTEEKKDEITLYQANPLTESRYEFSPTEKNAFYIVIRQVRKNYVEREPPRTEFENMRVEITPNDLVQIRGRQLAVLRLHQSSEICRKKGCL